jgi:hypothetical protein
VIGVARKRSRNEKKQNPKQPDTMSGCFVYWQLGRDTESPAEYRGLTFQDKDAIVQKVPSVIWANILETERSHYVARSFRMVFDCHNCCVFLDANNLADHPWHSSRSDIPSDSPAKRTSGRRFLLSLWN